VEGGAIDARWPILAGENWAADAAYIAALDPTTVTLLLDIADAADDGDGEYHDCTCTWHTNLRAALDALEREVAG
jgi:hypothetical protein